MALLSIGALFFGRSLSVWLSMAYVYLGMILRNPFYLLYDLGFIFSFTALAGLVFFAERRAGSIKKKMNIAIFSSLIRGIGVRFRNTYLLPSIAASIGIFTPLLFFTGRVNLFSIVSNLLIIPLVPFVMIYGFCGAIIYSVTTWQRILLPQIWAVDRIYTVNDRSIAHSIVMTAQT